MMVMDTSTGALAYWAHLFSMTDQQLPPCDTEPQQWTPEELAGFAAGRPIDAQPITRVCDVAPDPDHIWRCIQQAARGE